MKTGKKNKWVKLLIGLLCLIGLFVLSVFVYFFAWGMMLQPKPNNQPKLSAKEEEYFDMMEDRKGWKYVRRWLDNIDDKGESLYQRLVFLNKDYGYSFSADIEDSATFYSLPANMEETIALRLYNHVVDKSPKLRKITVYFSYEEVLNERGSIGHSRKKEFNVRGKRLVRVKPTEY